MTICRCNDRALLFWGERVNVVIVSWHGLPLVAVAWSIRNRVDDGKDKSWWGGGYTRVCQKPYQFNRWNRGDRTKWCAANPLRELAQCRGAADLVIYGKALDRPEG